MKLWVARHGMTAWNEQKLLCGRRDIPLSDAGRAQARSLAAQARACGIECVIASPLLRARETAEIVAKACDVPLRLDDRLMEQSFGSLEGTDFYGEDVLYYASQVALRYPGGESYFDLAARVYPFLTELKSTAREARALLVAHGKVCKIIRSYCTAMTDAEFYAYLPPNGGLEAYEL